MSLTQIQSEIEKALEQLSGKEKITDTILAKKVRENIKCDKKKAILTIDDIECALEEFTVKTKIIYAITVTKSNDLLLEKSENQKELSADARQRRRKSEKSQTIFTNKDVH